MEREIWRYKWYIWDAKRRKDAAQTEEEKASLEKHIAFMEARIDELERDIYITKKELAQCEGEPGWPWPFN